MGSSSDYLMRNTDRGADNYMIKHCDAEHEKPLVDVAPSLTAGIAIPQMSELRKDTRTDSGPSSPLAPPMSRSSSATLPPYTRKSHIHIAAIDNSLSFPHEHPKGWRSYTYGVSLQHSVEAPF